MSFSMRLSSSEGASDCLLLYMRLSSSEGTFDCLLLYMRLFSSEGASDCLLLCVCLLLKVPPMADSSSADKSSSSVARSPNHLTVTRHLWAHDNHRIPHASGGALLLSPKGSRRAYSSSNASLLSAGGVDEIDRFGSGSGGGLSSPAADADGLLGGAGGVTPHRRRRLILKAVHRSWPTSSSASSAAAAAGVGCAFIRTGRPRSVSSTCLSESVP